ncbi:MAG: Flp pilus assembly complex ATPase component TadA, partial [Phycisphaerae bacterium]|nr:Flp pilus assembly complex ATPase component TadA [Phycisphaerae bacterium]
AMLAEVDTTGRDIVALETRNQFPLEGISRCPIDREKGDTVADTLRSLCNQDVDVILIDDIPSRDAAVGAVEAAIAGRLVLAGIFARNSAVAMEMLLESAQPWTLASALLTVINLRTVRKICPKCRQEAKPPANLSLDFPVYRGAGCDECSQTGYAGVTGLFSLLHVDRVIAAILRNNDNAGEIISSAEQAGMDTLYQAGLKKVRDGITSLEELKRIHTPTV